MTAADDIIYIDGVEVNRKPVATKLNSTALPLGMGNNPIEGGQFFEGSLDEVKIYNKALTSDEILQLYATGTTGIKDLQNELQNTLRSCILIQRLMNLPSSMVLV